MKLVFLLEELSMKELLDGILPRILPENVEFTTIPHEGKSDLKKSIPHKLKCWKDPNVVAFVIVQDQDCNDCVALKKELLGLCKDCEKTVLIRIACHELEAWYWGDLEAVSIAFNKNLRPLGKQRKYRTPDNIMSPKYELKKHLPELEQISGARRIAPHMNIENNTSKSFGVFVKGLQDLCRKTNLHNSKNTSQNHNAC